MTPPEITPSFTAPFGEPDPVAALRHAPSDVQAISLQYCAGLKDLSPFARFAKLRKLIARNCHALTDVSALRSLPLIESLDLSDGAPADLSALAALPKLHTLWLFSQSIPIVPAQLGALVRLRSLFLAGSDFGGSLAFTGQLTELVSLDLGWCQVTDLAPLAALPNLAYLELGHASLPEDFSLPAMTQLKTLSLGGIKTLKALPSLGNLPMLTFLSASESPALCDVAALQDATSLETLILQNCPNIAGELPVAKCKKLAHVSLRGTTAQLPAGLEGLSID